MEGYNIYQTKWSYSNFHSESAYKLSLSLFLSLSLESFCRASVSSLYLFFVWIFVSSAVDIWARSVQVFSINRIRQLIAVIFRNELKSVALI